MGRVVGVSMAVPAMQEQMQHRAKEEQQVGKHTEDMRPVFGGEKNGGNGEAGEQDQPARRPPPTMLLGWITSTRPEAVPVIGPVVGQGVLSASIVALLAGAGIGALLGALWGSFSREAEAAIDPGSAAEAAWPPPIYLR